MNKIAMSIIIALLILGGCDEYPPAGMGLDGIDGEGGLSGEDGLDGESGGDGQDGVDGDSGVDGDDGQNGEDGQNGSDGLDGPGTRTVYSGTFNSSSEATLYLALDISNLPSIQAWGYSDSPTAYMFGVGWYSAAMSVQDDGSLKIYFNGGSGDPYRVVVVE